MKFCLQGCSGRVYERANVQETNKTAVGEKSAANQEITMHTSRPSGTREFPVASRKCLASVPVFLFCLLFGLTGVVMAQTAATGALKVTVTDPTSSVVPGVAVTVTSYATGHTGTVATQ